MSRFELTISPEYVPNWGLWQALRELQQNSIDQFKVDDSCSMIHLYEPENKRLIIGNENAKLSKRSLLLGESTKRNDASLIGKYGEGYKLALLILVRLGFKVTIFNGYETWTPKIIQSKKFEGDLLVVDVEESSDRKKKNNLIFYVQDISEVQYKEFRDNCLSFQDVGEVIQTHKGRILLNPKYAGKIYVEGLFVCKHDLNNMNIKYGYDFKAEYIPLDRDRMKVSSFDLFWLTSNLYKQLPVEYADVVFDLIENEYQDVSWFVTDSFDDDCKWYKMSALMADLKFRAFKEKFGENAFPVKGNSEYEFIKNEKPHLNPILVDSKDYKYYCQISSFNSNLKGSEEKETPTDILYKFFRENEHVLTRFENTKFQFEQLIDKSKNWQWR